ncbi:amino acid/polyamine transporter I [Bisporella sp. PMI_857]|nr:amino acid/polyamine transporter I [Bisporella sp. PMI_857]
MCITKNVHNSTVQEHEDPRLQRKLGKFNMIAMTFTILNTWIALAGIMGLVLPSGGAVAFLYGFIICVLCNLCLTASLGELASVWPTAGGQYHYTYMLGAKRWRRLASFSVGWLSIAGWLTLVTTACYFAAFFITAAAIVATDNAYESQPWKVYLIFAAIMVFTTLANLYGNRILDWWNNAALVWSLLSFAAISITLLATSNKTSAKYVFTGSDNSTGWSSGISCILGMVQSALSLIGSDAATHMSEEMPNPSRDTPRAMMYSVAIGGITGAAFLLVILFCLGNIDDILGTSTGMPITEMVYRSTGSRATAATLTFALAICFINGTNGAVTTVSRLMYAMARDGGAPGSRFFAKLDPKFNVPSRTILACLAFNLSFGLLYLGPTVAFNAYTASTTTFLNVSYVVPIIILLLRGRKILDQEVVEYSLGRMGLVWNWISVVFVIFVSVFLCFPAGIPVDASSMNYVTAVFGIFGLFVAITWALTRNLYHGPDITILTGIQPVNSAQLQIQRLKS